MDRSVHQRRSRVEYQLNRFYASNDRQRRYRNPLLSKPVAKTLKQLLGTVVVLTDIVKSVADVYLNRHQSDELITADSVSFAEPNAVALPKCEKTSRSSTEPAHVSRKRRRTTLSSSDDDDVFDAYEDDEDTLTYVLLPGERRASQLMYVLDDKNLYVRRYSFQNYDRYVCKAPHCRCTVQLSKPAGAARRSGDRTATHRHAHMEDEYVEITSKSMVEESTDDDFKLRPMPAIVYRQLPLTTAVDKVSSLPTPTTATCSSVVQSESEFEENVWTAVLNIEEAHEVSDVEGEFSSFRDQFDKTPPPVGEPKSRDQDEDTLRFEFVSGRRLDSMMLYTLDEKHMYRRIRCMPQLDRYVCYLNECQVSVSYDKEANVVRRLKTKHIQHCHPNAEERYHANKFLNTVKQDILKSEAKVSTVQIYESHAENNAEIAEIVPFKQIHSTLRRYRSRNRVRKLFKSPDTLADVAAAFQSAHIFETFGRSMDEAHSDFYRGTVVESTFGFSVFASAAVVQRLRQAPASDRFYHVDGTVNALPIGEFKQLLLLHWEHKNCLFPVAYALLTKRSTSAYVALFQYIEEHICQLRPISIMCDYAMPLRNVLHRMYPQCIRRPTQYNLVQAARRLALREPQLCETIMADPNQCRVFHKLMHLPVLPSEHMAAGFQLLRTEARTFGSAFNLFMDDIYAAWIAKPGGPISVLGSETSSAKLIETYTAGLLLKIRPGRQFFHFVDDLAKEEMNKADQLAAVSTQIDDSIKTKCTRHWNTIVRLQREIQDGKVDVAEFLQTLSMHTRAPLMSWNSFGTQLPNEVKDDNEEEEEEEVEEEINLPLCEKCGAAEQRKIVSQPCGHLEKCLQCYEEKTSNGKLSCPVCKASVKDFVIF